MSEIKTNATATHLFQNIEECLQLCPFSTLAQLLTELRSKHHPICKELPPCQTQLANLRVTAPIDLDRIALFSKREQKFIF